MNELNRKNDDNLIKGTTNDGNIGQKTVIEILLENFHGMSDNQIRDEIVTIMIGDYTDYTYKNMSRILITNS